MPCNHSPTEFHFHEIQGSVRVASNGFDAHNHRIAAMSCEPIELCNGGHAHRVTFRTDTYEGHYHTFSGQTTDAFPICDGHVHSLEGVTSEQRGHRHSFKLATLIEDPIED